MNFFRKRLILFLLIFILTSFVSININALELPKINPEFDKNCYKYWVNVGSLNASTFYNLDINLKNLLDTWGDTIDLNKHNIIATQWDTFLVVKKIWDKFILKTFDKDIKNNIKLYLYYICDNPEILSNNINIRYRLYDLETINIDFIEKEKSNTISNSNTNILKEKLTKEITKETNKEQNSDITKELLNNTLDVEKVERVERDNTLKNPNKYFLLFLYLGIISVLAILIFSVIKKARN